MEKFKKINEIMQYDSRFDIFVGDYYDDQNKPKGLKLHHIYSKVENINLNNNVPEDIQSQFNIAKNLFVYSWYVYSFSNVAELKAISTLEYALRMKLNKKKLRLRASLDFAIENNLIIDSRLYEKEKEWNELEKLYSSEIPEIDFKEMTKSTGKFLANYRNILAHGSTTLSIPSSIIINVVADFINQLFSKNL